MALGSNELYSSNSQTPYPRIQPDQGPGAVDVKTFATGSVTLPVGTPLALNNSTGHWIPWTDGSAPGANGVSTVRGFVYPDPITLDGSNEVLGQVMVKGTVHYDDLVTAWETQDGGSITANNIKGALRYVDPTTFLPQLRSQGLHIDGLDQLP